MPEVTMYREWHELAFEDPQQELVVRFEITCEEDDNGYRRVSRVGATAWQTIDPADRHHLPDLEFRRRTTIHHRFRTGDILDGWLEWQDRLVTDEDQQVTSRLELWSAATNETWNYEGYMVQFGGAGDQHHHAHQPAENGELQPAAGIDIKQVDLNAHELFPYVYLRPWPHPTRNHESGGFASIPAAARQNNPFWTVLAGLRSSGDAAKMAAEAVTFIEDAEGSPYAGQFVTTLDSMATPYNRYLDVWTSLHTPSQVTFEDLTAIVEHAFTSWASLEAAWATSAATSDLQRIWNSTISELIVMGYRHTLLADLVRALIVHHVLTTANTYVTHASKKKKKNKKKKATKTQNATNTGQPPPQAPAPPTIRHWIDATLTAPSDIFPLPSSQPSSTDVPTVRVRPYAIGATRSVHYEPHGYQLGEVHRIETIMRGETRELSNRNLSRYEHTKQSLDERRDAIGSIDATQTADLINQVQKTLSDQVTTTNIDHYKTDYGMPNQQTMSVVGKWWVQDQPSGGSVDDISKFARDVIASTVRDMTATVHEHRQHLHVQESEIRDLSRHHNPGDSHINGIYRWVNQTYRLRTRDLGDRLVLEIMLDAPAANVLNKLRTSCDLTIDAPQTPASAGVTSYTDISPIPIDSSQNEDDGVYYLDLFQKFGVKDDFPPPPASLTLAYATTSRNPVSEGHIDIPPGYIPTSALAQITPYPESTTIDVHVAGVKLKATQDPTELSGKITDADDRARIYIAALVKAKTSTASKATGAATPAPAATTEPAPNTTPSSDEFATYYLANVELTCTRSAQTLASWQYEAYRLIDAAYSAQRTQYLKALEDCRGEIERKNPSLLNDMITTELIAGAVAQIDSHVSNQTALPGPAGIATSQLTPRTQSYVQNALCWRDMNYQLFVPTDAKTPDDPENSVFQYLSPDTQFRNFIRANRARILVTVNADLARGFLYFLGTGQIWPDIDTLAPSLPDDQPLVTALKAADPPPSTPPTNDEWWIEVPTALTILSDEPILTERPTVGNIV